ncbi:C4-dicarboxylate TRAP transporter substrate-binding protein [Agrobacterium sp. ES01]|uniref:C4-dicarboxylate TRAP transporter substrate-binding protein n=1 Tax=Agrobacterium sp. ES01 TaxID=3420714 RepID=UPI003D0F9D18
MRRILSLLVGVAALAATTVDARELRVAPGAPPAHPSNSYMYQKLAEFLPEVSGGKLTAQVLGPEVVTLGQMKDALQSQLVEVGNLLPLYFPADLPNMSLAGELALSGREPHAMAAAMTEYIVTCETCQQELKKFGVVYLGSGSSDVYALLTTKPVHNAEDVKGLRLRSGGAPFSRWAENFGAVPANIGVGDTFESMSQGVIDGSMASIGDLLSFRLVELVKSITLVPLGTYHATSDFTVANPAWESLSVDERKQLATAANMANVVFTQRWGYDMAAEAKAAAEKAGIEFIEPDAAFAEASQDFAEADKETAAKVSQERFGFADAAERVARFSSLVEKWNGIVKDAKGDPDAITARLDEEIWSKVDFATYGM